MKKIIVTFGIFLVTMVCHVNAQRPTENMTINFGKIEFPYNKMQEGSNTVVVPDGKGTIKFVKRGDKFFDVFFTDAAGKTFRLIPSTPGSAGAPKPNCEYPIPDACFATADKNIGMCMCIPTDNSNGVVAGAHYKKVVIEMLRGGGDY